MQLSFDRQKGEEDMSIEITPEAVTELGKEFGSLWLANLTVDDILDRFEPKELVSHLKPEEVLPHFKPVDRLAGLSLSERFAGLSLSERFVGLEPEEIEDYLKQLKRQQH